MNDQAQPFIEDQKNPQRLFYILRLWRAEELRSPDWRASLENPETGQRIGFASLEQLFGYLMDRCEINDEAQDTEQER